MTIHWGLKTRNDRSVQETEQYLSFFFFTSDPPHCPTVLSAFTKASAWRVFFFLLYSRSQTYKCITATYLSNGPLTLSTISIRSQCGWIRGKKNNINTVQFFAQTDCFVSMYRHEPQGLIWFCLCMVFFSLKAMSPIDCHYMTDRLKRFELKNLRLCSTEETKSPTSWMPLG